MQRLEVLSQEDVRGLVHKVIHLDWDWSVDSVRAIAAGLGWTVADPGDAVGMQADTGLGVGRNIADIQLSRGRIRWISIRLTDRADDPAEALPVLQDTFVATARTIEEELGRPAKREPGRNPSVTWQRDGYAISLNALSRALILRVTSDEYLRTLAAESRAAL